MGIETLAIAGLAASVLSAGVGAVGAMQSASAQKQAADYQAAVARNNATIAQANADRAAQAGQIEAQQATQKAAALRASARAGAAANGLDVDTGSPVDIRTSINETGALDALTIQNNAMTRAAGYANQANSFTADATLDVMKGENAQSAGALNAFGSILGGASSFADKWSNYSAKGVI